MTREEFIAEYPLREGDSVDACHCGSCDCPGWKLVNIPEQRRLMDAMDRLPEVLSKAAYDFGYRLARERDKAFLKAFLGK